METFHLQWIDQYKYSCAHVFLFDFKLNAWQSHVSSNFEAKVAKIGKLKNQEQILAPHSTLYSQHPAHFLRKPSTHILLNKMGLQHFDQNEKSDDFYAL